MLATLTIQAMSQPVTIDIVEIVDGEPATRTVEIPAGGVNMFFSQTAVSVGISETAASDSVEPDAPTD